MAFETTNGQISIEASADLSANQHRFVDLDGSGEAAVAGAGALALGVQQNKPAAQGRATTVWGSGRVSKVRAEGALAVNVRVAAAASGRATTATSGNAILGRTLEASTAAGDLIAVYLFNGGFQP
jgi:hypothetical protein